MTQPKAKNFFEKFTGEPAQDFLVLAQSGSARINYKAVVQDHPYILTYNENLLENEAFFYFSEIFEKLNLNTPRILAISEDRKMYVQEYLGSQTLSEIIAKEGLSERVIALVKQSLEQLFELQKATENQIDYTKTFEYDHYGTLPVLHDLNYFKFLFVDVLGVSYQKSKLLLEFNDLSQLIKNLEPRGLMIRDFQARNIMVNDQDEVFFIDYQAAMHGPLLYDVVSFLYQGKANFPEAFKAQMLSYYAQLWEDEAATKNLMSCLEPLRLMRYLQVLGVYGLRGLVEKKPHFLVSIPQGLENINQLAQSWEGLEKFPELKGLILKLQAPEIKEKIKQITSL